MVTISFRAAETGDTGQAVEAACQPARKPLAGWRLPEGKRATLTRRPLPFLFVMCPECFFLMLFFCGYRACYCSSSFSSSSSSSSFRSSPAYGFSGRPPGGGGCRERSQRSCLRPGGLPSLTRNPGLQRPFRSRRLCRAVACAPGIPAKGRRDVRRNAVSQTALHVVAAGACPLLCPVPFTCLSPCSRGLIQPQPSPPVQG